MDRGGTRWVAYNYFFCSVGGLLESLELLIVIITFDCCSDFVLFKYFKKYFKDYKDI